VINMFIHNFKYSLKTLFRNRGLIFWTFAFPIILGTLFNMAFSNIESSEKLEIINIAIVDNDVLNKEAIFKETFNELSDEKNEERLFCTKYTDLEKAKEMLEKDEITGYILLTEDNPKVVVTTSGINQTILKYVVEEITQNTQIINNLSEVKINEQMNSGNYNIDYKKIYSEVSNIIADEEVTLKNISNSNLSYTMIEFYTLIAMTCLYGAMFGVVAINQNLANMSNNGKRVSVSPITKGKMILGSAFASYITQLVGIALLFVYTIFVLKVDYGTNLPLIILLTLIGCFAGLSLGIAIASLIKANDNIKTGIVISVTMLGCFLSGMMGITMKYVVDKNIPIINKINPASMITDGFYSLYYYNTLDRYYFNIISLVIFSLVMIILSFRSLRRQKYDSI